MPDAPVRRILVIDDHATVRRGLREILSESLPFVEFGEANNAQEALGQVRDSRWHLAVLDLNLPGQSGLELIRNLKDEQPNLRILVYSGHEESQFGLRAVRAGADGYLTKDRPTEEIARAVSTVLNGRQYLSAELTVLLVEDLKGSQSTSVDVLSDRELQVLRLLAAGKSPSQIGAELNLSSKTITTYRARVLEKLKLKTNADLVRYALENRLVP